MSDIQPCCICGEPNNLYSGAGYSRYQCIFCEYVAGSDISGWYFEVEGVYFDIHIGLTKEKREKAWSSFRRAKIEAKRKYNNHIKWFL